MLSLLPGWLYLAHVERWWVVWLCGAGRHTWASCWEGWGGKTVTVIDGFLVHIRFYSKHQTAWKP